MIGHGGPEAGTGLPFRAPLHGPAPPNLDRDGVEHYRLKVERLLNRLTDEAEAWAEAGTAKIDEVPVRREPAWSKWHKDSVHDVSPAHLALSGSAARHA